ncbi:MAG: 4a-hydroxytetrahydrobiopterin dehydratase [Planctomycetes bacterium TMED75]|nr:4a-hydroxytetrahydrobiopterin dehydratase [Planctomycetaceae bacterium]OUU92709.1 MAG: 4a-hydroxytetrahydrobiopterin dehydratase [Planctomycetes bacterium TMED75]
MTDQTQNVEKLTEEQVAEGLASLPEWSQNGDSIQRTITFEDFCHSMRFVNQIAEHAEKSQHHPDILVRYNKVTLTLSTHDAGGLSVRDMSFAKFCDSLTPSN